MLKTRVKRGAREMWHGMHSLFPPESQSLCESRADSIGFTGAKLITGSRAATSAAIDASMVISIAVTSI
jgi:hypothetical protein